MVWLFLQEELSHSWCYVFIQISSLCFDQLGLCPGSGLCAPPSSCASILTDVCVSFLPLLQQITTNLWLRTTQNYSLTILEVRSPKSASLDQSPGVSRAGCFWKLWGKSPFPCLSHLLEVTGIPWPVGPSSILSNILLLSPHLLLFILTLLPPVIRTLLITVGPSGNISRSLT